MADNNRNNNNNRRRRPQQQPQEQQQQQSSVKPTFASIVAGGSQPLSANSPSISSPNNSHNNSMVLSSNSTSATQIPQQDQQQQQLQQESPEDRIQRLHQRQKQILFGKATSSYVNYLCEVPISRRQPTNANHPVTPRIDLRNTKRQFDASVRAWRRALHVWDDSPSDSAYASSVENDTVDASKRGPIIAPAVAAAAAAAPSSPTPTSPPLMTRRNSGMLGNNTIPSSSASSQAGGAGTRPASVSHPMAWSTYKTAIYRAAQNLQAAVRAQFPSSVTSVNSGGSNNGSRSPGSISLDNISSSAASSMPNLGSAVDGAPPPGRTVAVMSTDQASQFVANWLQRFEDAAISAENTLFSSEQDTNIPSSAFSTYSDHSSTAPTDNSIMASSSGLSSRATPAGRRAVNVKVVKASEVSLANTTASRPQPQHQQRPDSPTSRAARTNIMPSPTVLDGEQRVSSGRGSGRRSQDINQLSGRRSAGGNTSGRRSKNAFDNDDELLARIVGSDQRPLRLSSLATSDTPSHLLLNFYQKNLQNIQFSGSALDRSGSPNQQQSQQQQHKARVQISPLDHRVEQWVAKDSVNSARDAARQKQSGNNLFPP